MAPGPIGAPCIPSDEERPNFSGFGTDEIVVENGAPACESGTCLIANFSGRVSCTYGQGPDDLTHCKTAGPIAVPVSVPVVPQKQIRPPETAVYCSCRCDGPDKTQNYCACPSGFECTPLVPDIGVGGGLAAGSYCVKTGTAPPADGNFGNDCQLPATDRRLGGCGPE